MKAMIFAAGLGTRLYPITLNMPKALVDVGGMPMLQQVLDKLPALDIKDVVVNVHHHAAMVMDFLNDYKSDLQIKVSDEREKLLDTGGGVVKALSWLKGEDVLLHNADILTDVPLEKMVERHKVSGADVTLLVGDRQTSRYLLVDDTMRMRGWENVTSGLVRPEGVDTSGLRRVAFGGVHLLSPRAMDRIGLYKNPMEPFSITDFYIDSVDKLNIQCFESESDFAWFDIGKPETLAAARSWKLSHNNIEK